MKKDNLFLQLKFYDIGSKSVKKIDFMNVKKILLFEARQC